MELLKNTKIATKLIALVALMSLLIAGVAAYGLKVVNDVNKSYQQTYDEDAYAATLSVQVGKSFAESRNKLTRYLYTTDPVARQQIVADIQNTDRQMDESIAQLEQRATSETGRKMINKTKADIAAYRTSRTALVNASSVAGTVPESLADFQKTVSSGDELGKYLDEVAALGTKGVTDDIRQMDSDIARTMYIMLIFTIVIVVVVMAIGMNLARRTGRRIERLGMVAQEIAQGNLSDIVQVDSTDEIGIAASHFEKMRQNLNQSMTNIHAAAEQVAAGSQNVSQASVSLSQGAAEQASSVEELSASISEISSQTASNAENAEKANTLTIQASQQASVGDADMKEMLVAMEAINTSSANISKIIKVIDEIAFQTNILALNAAVEAARAGQHGKGFAVVAEEVRNLAARSAKAATETTELIEDSITKVESGRHIAGKTAESLQTIMTNVSEVADIVGSIAKASSEQKIALEQIDQGVLQVSQVVQANSATSEESASASEELSAQAGRLKETASQFRLEARQRYMDTYAQPAAAPVPAAPVQQSSVNKTFSAQSAHRTGHDEGFGKY